MAASASMVRRVSHITTSRRAVVAEVQGDFDEYGLGDGSIAVTLTLEDGEIIAFEAGTEPDICELVYTPGTGDDVFVVKKSAIDYFRLELSHFRRKESVL